MPRRAPLPPPAKSRFAAYLPYIAGGVLVGFVILLIIRPWDAPPPTPPRDPPPFDPLAEADDAPPPMVAIPGGTFVMGSDDGADDERPAHPVTLRAFRMDATEVTNAQFAAFVKATGYVTVAERKPDQTKFPDAKAGSAVFVPVRASLTGPWFDPLGNQLGHPPWWEYKEGANWRHPGGPNTDLRGRMTHPAVHIAWSDAAAYATWAGKRLPTEAEWEYAARGGLDRQEFCWGSAKQGDGGKWYANTFQGTFPHGDTAADGFAGTAPVKSYPPNGYGLYDTAGNVWEWCADWYRADYYRASPKDDPPGPTTGDLDGGQPQRVRRGGSYLCAEGYCRRYLPSARDKNPDDSGACHTGFRCVK